MASRSLSVEYVAVVDKFVGGLKKAADSQQSFGDKLRALRPALAGLGTALGITAGFVAKLGMEHQHAAVMIQTAVQNTGRSWDAYKPKVEAAVKTQEHFGHNASDTQTALARLTTGLGSPDKALQGLSAAANLAALKHISLTDASIQLVKASGGSTRALRELGINTADLAPTAEKAQKAYEKAKEKVNQLADSSLKSKSAQEAYKKAVEELKVAHDNLSRSGDRWSQIVHLVQQKTHGLAENESKTLGGRLAELKAHVEDVAGSFGQKYGPALLGIGSVMSTVGPVFLGLGSAVKSMAGIAADAFKGLFSLFAANPFLLIIVAVIAVVVVVIKYWKQIKEFLSATWNEIKSIAGTVWHAIYAVLKAVWDGIKAAVLGYFNLYKTIIVGIWNAVKAVTSAVWNAIRDAIRVVWDWIKTAASAYFNAYKTVITTVWDVIKAVTMTVWNAIKTVVSTVILAVKSVITSTITAIKNTWDAIWNGMKATAEAVVNAVLGFFTGLVDGIRHMVDAIGGFFSKLAFWRHSPSQLEINAELSTKNAIASFERMRSGMTSAMADIGGGLLSGPIVSGRSTFATPATPAPARQDDIVQLLERIAARLEVMVAQERSARLYVDGKELKTALAAQGPYADVYTRGRS
jgi:hypothetical protein